MEITDEQKPSELLSRLDVSILPFPEKYLDSAYLSLGTGVTALVICILEVVAPSEVIDIGLDLALAAIIFGALTVRRDKRWGQPPLAGIIMGAITWFFFLFCIAVYHPGAAHYIQRSSFEDYPHKPIGQAVDSFISNPRWEIDRPADPDFLGYTIVNLYGGVIQGGQKKQAVVQFLFDNATREFELVAMEVDGWPVNEYAMDSFIDTMMKKSSRIRTRR